MQGAATYRKRSCSNFFTVASNFGFASGKNFLFEKKLALQQNSNVTKSREALTKSTTVKKPQIAMRYNTLEEIKTETKFTAETTRILTWKLLIKVWQFFNEGLQREMAIRHCLQLGNNGLRFFASILTTHFPRANLSALHVCADRLLDWNLAAKWAQPLNTYRAAANQTHWRSK